MLISSVMDGISLIDVSIIDGISIIVVSIFSSNCYNLEKQGTIMGTMFACTKK